MLIFAYAGGVVMTSQRTAFAVGGASLGAIFIIYFQCRNHIFVIGVKRDLSIDKNQTSECEYLLR